MADYEYILKQAKKSYYTKWDDEELRKCVDMLEHLSRRELLLLYNSRWVFNGTVLRQQIFNVLFKEQIGKREERVKNLETVDLIAEFQDKKSGNVALVRKEMRDRYKAGKDKQLIADAFSHATKSDQQWVKSQIRKEQYGDSNNHNYQWKKTSWK
jgi:hypothetical protein